MRSLVSIGLLGTLFCVGLAGQETGGFSGFVWDPSGELVAAASVTAVNEDTGFRRTAETDAAGLWTAPYLYPGRYKLTVRKEGFRTIVQFGVPLHAAEATRVDFHLQIGDVLEVVTVSDAPRLAGSEDVEAATLVGRNWIDHLPLNGRGILSLLELAPGSIITPASAGEAGQFSVNGQRPNTNYFTVDGAAANTGANGGGLPAQMAGGSLPGMTAFGSLQSLASVEALDEFQLRSSSFEGQYGPMPGGQIGLSTRSGSNDFQGVAFGVFRNEALDANDWFANSAGQRRQALRFEDFGGAAGGPIRRNRTFFFFSYEGLRLRQPYTWQSTVPSVAVRAAAPPLFQPILNAFPVPNGPDLGGGIAEWTGFSSRPSSFDGLGIRVDHALTSRLLAFARFSVHTFCQFVRLHRERFHSPGRSFRDRRIECSHHAFGDERISHQWNVCERRIILAEPRHRNGELQYRRASIWSGNSMRLFLPLRDRGAPAAIGGTRYQQCANAMERERLGRGQARLARDPGRHRLPAARAAPGAAAGECDRHGCELRSIAEFQFLIGLFTSLQNAEPITQAGVFGEDTWRATSRLTIDYGVRWDVDPSPVALPPGAGSAGAPIWKARYTQFAPHFGAAYRLTSDGRTVLRSGGGRYFDADFGASVDGINGAPYNAWQFNNGATTSATSAPPPILIGYAFASDLRVPSTWEWNATLERALGRSDVLSVGWVGAAANDLLRREMVTTEAAAETVEATNHGWSRYNALQVQYRRRLAHRVQAQASYNWLIRSTTALRIPPFIWRCREPRPAIADRRISMCATRWRQRSRWICRGDGRWTASSGRAPDFRLRFSIARVRWA